MTTVSSTTLMSSPKDVDVYRMSIKKHITEWRASLSRIDAQEWLIILVSAPEAPNVTKKRFQAKTSMIDKLRADFNVGKRDRCAHLAWSLSTQDPTLWAPVVGAMKEGITFYLETFVSTREDHLRRLENSRQSADWDFMDLALSKVVAGLVLLDEAAQSIPLGRFVDVV